MYWQRYATSSDGYPDCDTVHEEGSGGHSYHLLDLRM